MWFMQFIWKLQGVLQKYGKYLEALNFFSGSFAFFKSSAEFSYFSFFLILLSSTTCFTLPYYPNTVPHLPFPIRIVVPHFLPQSNVYHVTFFPNIWWSALPKILNFFLSYSLKIEQFFSEKQGSSSATKATVFVSTSKEWLGLANCYNFRFIDEKRRIRIENLAFSFTTWNRNTIAICFTVSLSN